jgi:signal peptide peptidase SppA
MATYKGQEINTKPTEAVANAAKRGLRLRKEFKRGGTRVGVTRANQLARRDELSTDTVKRMKAYFDRHAVDMEAPKNKDPDAAGYPGAGLIAWLLWGGNPGRAWANRIVDRMKTIDEQQNSTAADNKVWAINPKHLQAASATLSAELIIDDEDDDDMMDDYAMAEENGVAIIPVAGVIGHKVSAVSKLLGAVDTVDVIAAIELAAEDDDIDTIILDIDSPGGTVGGVPELAETVEDVQRAGVKMIYAYTDSMMASAAYWMAAGANGIFAAPSAEVGSIGVYLPVMDTSKALAEKGVTVEIFKSGKYKAAGFPGVALDEEVRKHLQLEVMETYNEFAGFVKKYRAELNYEHMQGQTLTGRKAADVGMVDGTAKNLDSLLQKLGKA